MNGLKLFPNFMSGFFAMDTSKDFLTNSIKQSILSSSIPFGVILIHNTGNGFVGDLRSKGIESLKVTRYASFPIAIVSPIELGWSTTSRGHSLGF